MKFQPSTLGETMTRGTTSTTSSKTKLPPALQEALRKVEKSKLAQQLAADAQRLLESRGLSSSRGGVTELDVSPTDLVDAETEPSGMARVLSYWPWALGATVLVAGFMGLKKMKVL